MKKMEIIIRHKNRNDIDFNRDKFNSDMPELLDVARNCFENGLLLDGVTLFIEDNTAYTIGGVGVSRYDIYLSVS